MIQFIAGAIFGAVFGFMILAIVSAGSIADKREEREIEEFKKKL